MNFNFQFSDIIGSVYKNGCVYFLPDGVSILSPIGNKLKLLDLKRNNSRTLQTQFGSNIVHVSANRQGTHAFVSDEFGCVYYVNLNDDVELQKIFPSNGDSIRMIKLCPERLHFLFAMTTSVKAHREYCYEARRFLLRKSIESFQDSIKLDPKNNLSYLYCALDYAMACDLQTAAKMCKKSIDINSDEPTSYMLMALIFTAQGDNKNAVDLIKNALVEFPSHYGLLVLRLKLEALNGYNEEVLNMSHKLIYFWRKTKTVVGNLTDYDERLGETKTTNSEIHKRTSMYADQNQTIHKIVTPILTAPVGISCLATPSQASMTTNVLDFTFSENQHLLQQYDQRSDSFSFLSSSSKSWISFSLFRMQADFWAQLAELFIEFGRIQEIQACIEEACMIYPNSHQTLYLKGHLLVVQAESCLANDFVKCRKLLSQARNYLLGSLSIVGTHIPSFMCLNRIYNIEGNVKMVDKILRDIISINPLEVKSWRELGRISAEQGLNEEAIEYYNIAESLHARTPVLPFSAIPRTINGAATSFFD